MRADSAYRFSFSLQALWITCCQFPSERDLLFKLLASPGGILHQGLLDVLQSLGVELKVVDYTLLPGTDGVGRLLSCKIEGAVKRALGNAQLVPDLFHRNLGLGSIAAAFRSLERCFGIVSIFAAIVTDGPTKCDCANRLFGCGTR
jgi:hypothetical protein